jgi:hypothetical protein
MNYSKIESFRNIIDRSLNRRDSNLSYDRTVEAVIRLAEIVHETPTDESVWYLGEHSLDLASLIIGSYWFFSDHHGGQNSPEYRACCALATVFRPGICSGGPEPESTELDCYTSWKHKAGKPTEEEDDNS